MTNSTPSQESLHDTASDLLEGYVLGALDLAKAAVVDEHLDEGHEGREDCEEEVSVLARIAQSLPLASRLVNPAGELKSRVLFAVAASDVSVADHADPPTMMRRGPRAVSIWSARRFQAVAASMVLLAVGGLLAWAIVLQTEADDLQGENVALTAMMDLSAERLDDSIATTIFALSGTNSSSLRSVANGTDEDATARMVWDADEANFRLVAKGLDPTAEGGAYVTWAELDDGRTTKLTHFYVGQSGATLVDGTTVVRLSDVKSFTITHEDDAEVSSPSRQQVLPSSANRPPTHSR